jgi:hypothetical protein
VYWLGDVVAALELFELVRLEEERTGRIGNNPWLVNTFAPARRAAQEQAGPALMRAAAASAKQVPPPDRAARAIAIAIALPALAARRIQD